jgi:hypothetical protein
MIRIQIKLENTETFKRDKKQHKFLLRENERTKPAT